MTVSTLNAEPDAATATLPAATVPPADEAERVRFIGELQTNFSVIAPAGVGKTRSIVERIAAITAAPNAVEVLPYLLVVTYTDRAAREMKRRTRQRVLQMQQSGQQRDVISSSTMAAFNQAFFGTIHSLCVRLLKSHGHFLGVPAKFEVADDDRLDELWDEFISNDIPWNRSLRDEDRDALLRHVGLLDLFRLSREVRLPLPEPLETPGPVPEANVQGVLAELRGMIASAKKGPPATVTSTLEAVERFERQMARAEEAEKAEREAAGQTSATVVATDIAPPVASGAVAATATTSAPPPAQNIDKPLPGELFCPLPERQTDAKAIRELWEEAFRPLRDWLSRAATRAAVEIAEAFRQFRIAQGVLTFDDQVALALELLQTPDVAARVLQKPWRIILDEAQDTDPIQFQVLLRLAQGAASYAAASTSASAASASAIAPAQPSEFAPLTISQPAPAPADRCLPGRFSMVGDFQQSIYGQRADIPTYRQHHRDLLEAKHGAEAVFKVTFRCSRSVVNFVNSVFPHVFAAEEKAGAANAIGTGAAAAALGDQARFVRLEAASTAAEGRTFRVPLPSLPDDSEPGESAFGLSGAPQPTKRKRQTREIETHIAQHIANVVAREGLAGLQASRWSEVAILCPRIAWLHPLRKALAAKGIDSQNLSTHDIVGDHPARAWFSALAWIMAEPLSGYEIVGVLRDIFGISDDALAVFSGGDGARFQIAHPVEIAGPFADEETGTHGNGHSSGAAHSHSAKPPTTARTVASTLYFLALLREEISTVAVRTAAQRLAVATRLLERLELLPDVRDWPPDSMREELETLLILAAHAEASGTSFRAFAHSLRTSFSSPRPDTRMKPEAVQLITSYKAKGLEWDAVILPFLHREIPIRAKQHPRFLQLSPGQNPRVIFSSQDNSEPDRAAVDRLRDMEFERLLYVMCTRARHTLMLADDTACWPAPRKNYVSGSSSPRTFTKCLKLAKVPAVQQVWDALPVVDPEALSGSGDISEQTSGESSTFSPSLALTQKGPNGRQTAQSGSGSRSVQTQYESPDTLPLFQHVRDMWEMRRDKAVRAADRFPRRVTPHSLAKTEDKLGQLPAATASGLRAPRAELLTQGHVVSQGQGVSLSAMPDSYAPASILPSAISQPAPGDPENAQEPEDARPLHADRPGGTEYGTWWHALMESLPWSGPSAGPKTRQDLFDAALFLCQLQDRARREYALLEASPLPAILSAPGLVLHTELPFLLPSTEMDCLEGIIDMAWYDPGEGSWTVLDWKTNFITAHQTEELRAMYAPQLQAYARALSALTGKPARAVLYSTTLGKVIEVG